MLVRSFQTPATTGQVSTTMRNIAGISSSQEGLIMLIRLAVSRGSYTGVLEGLMGASVVRALSRALTFLGFRAQGFEI